MNRLVVVGLAVTILGLAGYGFGTLEAYPGRAFSVTGIMLGITLLAIGRAKEVTRP